jgi:NhaA family Na+:H+ antiporter
VRSLMVYLVLGAGLWGAFLASGIHATLAGVLLAMTIPARALYDSEALVMQGHRHLKDLLHTDESHGHGGSPVQALAKACSHSQSPMERLEHALLPWVDFMIMPVFALANAGVHLEGDPTAALTHPVGLGIMAGLVIGKQIGIFSASWTAVKLGLGRLPAGVSWGQLYGAACLGGIGFTMSLFVSGLSFEGTAAMATAKIAIICASIISAGLGATVLTRLSRGAVAAPGAEVIPLHAAAPAAATAAEQPGEQRASA